jgi:hypothetical protein
MGKNRDFPESNASIWYQGWQAQAFGGDRDKQCQIYPD